MSTKGGYVEILEISQRHFELHILFYQSDQKDEKQAKYLYEISLEVLIMVLFFI